MVKDLADLWATSGDLPMWKTSGSHSFCETSDFETSIELEDKTFGYPNDFHPRYELIEVIGRGSYGVVWRAKCRQTSLTYAVKILEKKSLDTAERLERVRREVLYQATMGPSLSVAYLFKVFEDEDKVYMVMEMCEGGPLWNRVKAGQYNEAQAACIIKAALQAVAQCHARGIILRDVKPHNFLFLNNQEDSPLKLTDFGLAAQFDPMKGMHQQPFKKRVGTSLYMAPEVVGRLTQWPPLVQYGPKADLWSVGVMAYQLLCGRLPYKTLPGKGGEEAPLTSADAFAAITLGALDFKNAQWDKLSPPAKNLVSQLLQTEAEDRPSAREALQHPWLYREGVARQAPLGDELIKDVVHSFQVQDEPDALQYLQRFGGYTHLKQAALRIIAEKHVLSSDDTMKHMKHLQTLFTSSFLSCIAQEGGEDDDEDMEVDMEQACLFMMSSAELVVGLKDLGHDVSEAEARRLLRSIDVKRTGTVELPTFIAALCDWQMVQQDSNWDDWVLEAFNNFDKEKRGFLDAAAVEAAISSQDAPRVNSARRDLHSVDSNKDGKISLEEFKFMLESDLSELSDYDSRGAWN
eukprot:CAMPEP_0196580708 /NCGR_PEP_ID=MMETSP1081-20130531/30201_1 /TAXON_ID=36882 /ORGANISM="Pyramimonas amylifera, Strain CCMP720" /LENGTH=576 /DNA_ID=CAMNT_0041900663 /DNA_START=686 /DNA_END=2416 /DNA_ORIENTATION=+